MIPVREVSPGVFEPVVGNPVLRSIDGKVKAPLQTILAGSWTESDRAKFGVYMAEPFDIPEGKQKSSNAKPSYALNDRGEVVEAYQVDDVPPPKPGEEVMNFIEAARLENAWDAVMLHGLDYPVFIQGNTIRIACEVHTVTEWANFTDDEIAAMDGFSSARFWRDYKQVILTLAGHK